MVFNFLYKYAALPREPTAPRLTPPHKTCLLIRNLSSPSLPTGGLSWLPLRVGPLGPRDVSPCPVPWLRGPPPVFISVC